MGGISQAFTKSMSTMHLMGIPLSQITEKDILQLVADKIPENVTLEYKRELTLDADKTKARDEFLSDVTSLVNTSGGCIIYGIEEKRDPQNRNTGVPGGLHSASNDNYDNLQQKIHQALRQGTNPPVSVEIRRLVVNAVPVILIGVPKRSGLPSMVTYNDNGRIYRRNSAGKYVPDVYELEQLFLANGTNQQEAELLRQSRIEAVINQHVYPDVVTKGAFFIHAIPLRFRQGNTIAMDKIKDLDEDEVRHPLVIPMSLNRPGLRAYYQFNADGYMSYSCTGSSKDIYCYNQFFRNGVVEFYTTQFMHSREDNPMMNGDYVFGAAIAGGICGAVQRATRFWKYFQIEPEFLVFVSFRVPFSTAYLAGINKIHEGGFPKKIVDLPPVTFNGLDFTNGQIYDAFQSNLDAIWQIAGKPKAPTKELFFHPSSMF